MKLCHGNISEKLNNEWNVVELQNESLSFKLISRELCVIGCNTSLKLFLKAHSFSFITSSNSWHRSGQSPWSPIVEKNKIFRMHFSEFLWKFQSSRLLCAHLWLLLFHVGKNSFFLAVYVIFFGVWPWVSMTLQRKKVNIEMMRKRKERSEWNSRT